MKQTEILTHATHVNDGEPAVCMSCMSQNFRIFHVSNLSFKTFEFFCSCIRGQSPVGNEPINYSRLRLGSAWVRHRRGSPQSRARRQVRTRLRFDTEAARWLWLRPRPELPSGGLLSFPAVSASVRAVSWRIAFIMCFHTL